MNCKIKRRIFSIFIALTLLMSLAAVPVHAASGTCGANLTWILDENSGEMLITGSGEMINFSNDEPIPWSDFKSSIKRVLIYEGVTSIGDNAFLLCENLTDITIPDSVIRIGQRAFMGCNLKTMTIGNGIKTIGDRAIVSVDNPDIYYNGAQAEWNAINIEKSNIAALENSTMHFNSKSISALAPTIPSEPTIVSIDDSELPQAKYNTGYHIQFQMPDGTAPAKVEFTNIKPAGLTVNSNGTIIGIPRAVGNYTNLPVKCTDRSGNTIIKKFDLQILPQEVHIEIDGSAVVNYDGNTHTLPVKCLEVSGLELSTLYGVNKTAAPTEAGTYYAQILSKNNFYRVVHDHDFYLTIEKAKVEITHTPQTYTYDGKPHEYKYTTSSDYVPVVKYKPFSNSDNLTQPNDDSGYTETAPTSAGIYRVWISAADKNHSIYDDSNKSPWYVFGILTITNN